MLLTANLLYSKKSCAKHFDQAVELPPPPLLTVLSVPSVCCRDDGTQLGATFIPASNLRFGSLGRRTIAGALINPR